TGVTVDRFENPGGGHVRYHYNDDGDTLPIGPIQVVLVAGEVADQAGNFNVQRIESFTAGSTGSNTAPTIRSEDLTLSATTIPATSAVTLSGVFADPDMAQSHTVAIDWGDGSADDTIVLSAGVLAFGPVSHT